MLKRIALAAFGLGALAAATTPALADQYCGPGFYLSRHYHECQPYHYSETPGGVVSGTVGTAGYVAGSAVNAAGNVAGDAVNGAANIAGGVIGAVTGR